MSPQFQPTIEALEARDAPVILITVVLPLTILELGGINFTLSTDPHHSFEKEVVTRGASVSITLDPCPRC